MSPRVSTQVNLSGAADTIDAPLLRDVSLPHATDLLKAVEARSHGKEPESDVPEWVQELGHFGRIWEPAARKLALAYAHPYQFTPSPRVVHLGVICSLDGVVAFPHGLEVVEFKTRWAAPPDFPWRWDMQVKAYCGAMKTRRAVMWALYIWRHSNMPRVALYRHMMEYEGHEITAVWSQILLERARQGWPEEVTDGKR